MKLLKMAIVEQENKVKVFFEDGLRIKFHINDTSSFFPYFRC